MVNSNNLACKNATGTTISGTPVKWCSVTLSEVVLQGKRLEASVFDVEAKQARDSIVHGRYPCVTLGGTEGLIDKAYYPGRFKRIYCEQGCGEAFFLPVATVSSTIVFHSPHAGHLPIHFGLSFPHSLQNHTLLVFTVAISVS